MKLLVTGGRDFTDRGYLFGALDCLHSNNRITLLIHGAARGADTMAAEWAYSRGIEQKRFPVSSDDWNKYGKAAGHIRNKAMLEKGVPDMVIAFPGGNGTINMVQTAQKKANLPIILMPGEE